MAPGGGQQVFTQERRSDPKIQAGCFWGKVVSPAEGMARGQVSDTSSVCCRAWPEQCLCIHGISGEGLGSWRPAQFAYSDPRGQGDLAGELTGLESSTSHCRGHLPASLTTGWDTLLPAPGLQSSPRPEALPPPPLPGDGPSSECVMWPSCHLP